jgi:two-component SAPR family response regulator
MRGGSQKLKGVSALIVEDEYLIFLGIELVLNDAGAKVIGHCRSLSEAQDFITARPSNSHARFVAVLDVRLGNETSLPFAHELRKREIPFLFYSGQADWRAIEADFPGVPLLTKPVSPDALVEEVRPCQVPAIGKRGKPRRSVGSPAGPVGIAGGEERGGPPAMMPLGHSTSR